MVWHCLVFLLSEPEAPRSDDGLVFHHTVSSPWAAAPRTYDPSHLVSGSTPPLWPEDSLDEGADVRRTLQQRPPYTDEPRSLSSVPALAANRPDPASPDDAAGISDPTGSPREMDLEPSTVPKVNSPSDLGPTGQYPGLWFTSDRGSPPGHIRPQKGFQGTGNNWFFGGSGLDPAPRLWRFWNTLSGVFSVRRGSWRAALANWSKRLDPSQSHSLGDSLEGAINPDLPSHSHGGGVGALPSTWAFELLVSFFNWVGLGPCVIWVITIVAFILKVLTMLWRGSGLFGVVGRILLGEWWDRLLWGVLSLTVAVSISLAGYGIHSGMAGVRGFLDPIAAWFSRRVGFPALGWIRGSRSPITLWGPEGSRSVLGDNTLLGGFRAPPRRPRPAVVVALGTQAAKLAPNERNPKIGKRWCHRCSQRRDRCQRCARAHLLRKYPRTNNSLMSPRNMPGQG
jgi:hypothetical protein